MFANIFNSLFIFSHFFSSSLYDKPSNHIFHWFPFLSITKDYNSLFHTLCTAVSLCHHLSLPLSFFLVCVWVEVMFENDNTRKLKTEGGNTAQQCIAVLHPLCVLCYYFLKYQPNAHQADDTHRNASSICAQIYSKNLVLVDGKHLAAAIGQWAHGVAGPGLDVRRAGSRREKEVTRLQPRAVDLLVSAE